ncbi:GntR family transcriptional regulator [Propylenella binzhouense]|nr:GntR family transcriptional regulator [Propylenella binzhouense]
MIVERLEASIVSGEIPPGTKLSEVALAHSLGVSRGPLREAIRRLEGRKLLQRTPNIGVRVAELTENDLSEILVIREALEGMACREACLKMPDSEIKALRQLLRRHGSQAGLKKGTGYYQEGKDFDFHFRIIKGSQNERLIQMLCGDLYDLLRVYRYKSSTLAGRAKAAYNEHEKIVLAIESRDPDAAEAAMREHLRNARAYLEQRKDGDCT